MEIIVCILIGAALITAGVMLIINGGKRQQKPMLIGGWVLTIAAIVGTIVGVILFAGLGKQSLTSAFITYAFPAMMLIGFIIAIGVGVGNLLDEVIKHFPKQEAVFDDGEVLINGYVPWIDRKKYVKDIGVVFGQRSQLWWDIPAIDSFSLLKDIYKIDEKEYKKTLKELLYALNCI